MTVLTMDGCSSQAILVEETARQIREGGFTTGNRPLDWALALHNSDVESDGFIYMKFEDRVRAHPGEQISIFVHQRIKPNESTLTLSDARSQGSLERLWLGALVYPLPEPPLRWERGELLLPICHVEEVVSYLHGHASSRKTTVRADGAGLALSVLCAPGIPLTLREFVHEPYDDSVIRVGKQEVGRFIAQTYTPLKRDFESALASIRQPSLELWN